MASPVKPGADLSGKTAGVPSFRALPFRKRPDDEPTGIVTTKTYQQFRHAAREAVRTSLRLGDSVFFLIIAFCPVCPFRSSKA
ncbi:hypothetical protein PG987_016596 [Apiospora arundinis]